MSLEGKKIVFEVSDTNFQRELDEDTPQDVFINLLFDVQSGGNELEKLLAEDILKVKCSSELLPDNFESYSLEYVEEILNLFIHLDEECLVRGVSSEDEDEYSKRMKAVEKTGRDKMRSLMSREEIRSLESQGVDPEHAIWATKNYRKAWEYTERSPVPRRVLLFYDSSKLEQPSSVNKPYLFVSKNPEEALEAVAVFEYH